MTNVVDPTRTPVSLSGDGSVVFTPPDGPWKTIRLWTRDTAGRPGIRAIRLDARDVAAVTAGRLAALPLRQMLHVVAAHEAAISHPNEAFYRLLAKPKPKGQRHWDDDHYRRVLQVYDWAKTTRRPGGPRRAVADMWGVALDPTVNRWLAEARRRADS